MNGLSALAQTFEAKSKALASDTEKAVQSALQQHEKHLIEQLRSSEQTLSAAIQSRERLLTRFALRSWAWAALSIALALAGSYGALWWTGQQIAHNLDQINQQNQMLSRAQALGLTFHQEGGEQYIILPQGLKATMAGALNGRTAIKLGK